MILRAIYILQVRIFRIRLGSLFTMNNVGNFLSFYVTYLEKIIYFLVQLRGEAGVPVIELYPNCQL